MKTKGALVWDFDQPWSIEEIEIGDPRRGEVGVQLEYTGMCHSDHHVVTGDIPVTGFPVLGGHEGAGVVTEVGEGVDDLAPGDHVATSFIPSCGSCRPCRTGMLNLCDLGMGLMSGASVTDGSFRVRARDRDVYPYALLGTFSPYLVVHRSSLVKIDPAVPLAAAALVSCGVTTGYGSATRAAGVRPGEDVAVIGLGGVGAAALQGAAHSGARHVFVVEPAEWKHDLARKLGATHVYSDIAAALAGIVDATLGRMAHKVIVTVGRINGADVETYLSATAKGGTCVLTSMGAVLETDVTLNLAGLTLLQKNLQGSIFGHGNPQHDIPMLLSLYTAGKLNLDDMITTTYTLEQINEGYRDMLDGNNIRGIIRYTDADR
jgi:S-(hydroxymethyl)glutathione dehydrogenase / alcohol dehydrogenase